jgi:predicted XRE-type DNA-binding protein
MSKSNHVTTGDVLDDLGFSRSEASALKIKASIVEAILAEIDRRGFTQRQLVDLLGACPRNADQCPIKMHHN